MKTRLGLYLFTNQRNFEKEVLLDKINETQYRVLEYGEFKPLLKGGNIIENTLLEILMKYVPNQISLVKKINIWRKSTNEIWDNYSEVEIKNHLDLDSIKDADFNGFKIYQLFFDSMYVSSSLKDKIMIEYEKSSEIDFTNDFPLYA